MLFCKDGMRIGPYLIKNNILCDPVSSYEHAVYKSLMHCPPGHRICNQGYWNLVLHQFPGSDPASLVQGPGLTGDNLDLFAFSNSRTHNSKGCAPVHTGEPACVTVCEYCISVLQEFGSIFAY